MARHVDTAVLLERRAASCDNRVLAALLEERAACHRRAADRVLCSLTPAVLVDCGVPAAVR